MDPIDCDWGPDFILEAVIHRDDNQIRKLLESQTIRGFVDSAFPPRLESIGEGEDAPEEEVEWVRGPMLSICTGEEQNMVKLYDKIEPQDIMQGALGDCWLLAALAQIAEFPEFIENNILKERKLNPEGKYTINLYDMKIGDWIEIEVDDFIPCQKRLWWQNSANPLFAQPNGNELYILILEKAFAKYAGGYTKLCGGMAAYVWQNLTGCEV